MYEKILVAYNEGPGARAALGQAEAIASALGGNLTLVRSVTEGPLAEAAKPETIATGRTALEREINRYHPDLDAELWVVGGPAGEALVAAANEMSADLIVTGSRHHRAITRAILGSVSSELVHNASCDVLVVHPTED